MKDYSAAQEHLKKVLEGKRKLKEELIKLPFEEKVKRIVEMQKFAASLNPSRNIYVWELD